MDSKMASQVVYHVIGMIAFGVIFTWWYSPSDEPIAQPAVWYERACVLIRGRGDTLLFLLDVQDSILKADLPGGMPITLDQGKPITTAIRTVFEETGISPHPAYFGLSVRTAPLESQLFSLYALIIPIDELHPTKLGRGYVDYVYSKIYKDRRGWYIRKGNDRVPIRNTHFLDQVEPREMKKLHPFIV
jgi:hypothetical protein